MSKYHNNHYGWRGSGARCTSVSGQVYCVDFGADDRAWSIGGVPLQTILTEYTDCPVYIHYGFAPSWAVPITPARFLDLQINTADGNVDVDLYGSYSEITGHLWTNECGRVGGHDLVQLLIQNSGNWCYFAISTVPFADWEDADGS